MHEPRNGGEPRFSNFYLLMPLALIALYLPGPPKALKLISGIGSVLGSLARFWEHAFMYTFGWGYSGLDT